METGQAPTMVGSPRSDGETPVDQVPGGKVKKYPSVGFSFGLKGPSLNPLFLSIFVAHPSVLRETLDPRPRACRGGDGA